MRAGGTSLARTATVEGGLPAGRQRQADERSVAPTADAVLDVLGAGVLAIAPNGLISRANPKAARILRRALPDLVGRPVADILAPLPDLLSIGHGRGERLASRPDGSAVALGFSISVAETAELVRHHVVLFQEITSIVELRGQRDRLLQTAVLAELMPTLLHDIRNPLAAALAMLELLAEDGPPSLERPVRDVLGHVHRITLSLQGIASLVQTMHSSMDCALDRAVRETCQVLAPLAQQRGVVLRATGPDLPLLGIDGGAISGVVFNLVKNAVEASTGSGTIEVNASLEGDHLVLVVTDDGAGMTPETLERCRELFFTTKASGSGIGLALCERVARASGGRLDIESRVGAGTRVTLRVPTSAPPRESRPDSTTLS